MYNKGMKKNLREKYIFNKKCLLILLYLFYINDVSYKDIIFRSFGFHFDPKCNYKVIVNSKKNHLHKYVVHIYNSIFKLNLEEQDVMGNINFIRVKDVSSFDPYLPLSSLNIYFDESSFFATGFIEGKKVDYDFKNDNKSIFKGELLYSLNSKKEKEVSFILYLLKLYSYRLNFDLVLGAGVNIDYGIKGWKELVETLSDKFYESNKERINEIKDYMGNELFVSSKMLNCNNFDTYKELHDELYLFKMKKSFDDSSSTLALLADFIGNHTKTNVITYNYDTNLEYLLKKRGILYNSTYDDNSFLIKEAKTNIYHVHGLLPFEKYKEDKFTDSLIFNESEYYYLYNNPYSWNIAIQLHEFKFNTNLFIGISLTDPNMKRLLELAENPLKFNFIFMKKEDGYEEKTYIDVTNYFFQYDLITIWIDEYKEIEEWLKALD